jgi:salicylate hydroxylase
MSAVQPVIIAGGGIGGLAAALGLARKGFEALVLEKSPSFAEIGAGIQLAPNAFHAFDRLGIGEEMRAMAVMIDRLLLMDAASGEEITHIPLDAAFRAHFGNPYAVVHRGELHGALLRACRRHPSVALRAGAEVVGYAQSETGVAVHLADGEMVEGCALIGADGLHSRVRAQLVGDGAPRVSGHVAYRAVIPAGEMPEDLRWNAATLWAGPKCHMVHYPLQGWRTFNLVATFVTDQENVGSNEPGTREEVLSRFAHIVPKARKLLEVPTEWRRWVLADRDPIPRWVDGRVALLGDAAHPMYPVGSNGASQAILDARVLAYELSNAATIDDGLRAYETHRRPVASEVQLANRRQAGDVMARVSAMARRGAHGDAAAELQDVERRYKQLAGFDVEALNNRKSWSVSGALPQSA